MDFETKRGDVTLTWEFDHSSSLTGSDSFNVTAATLWDDTEEWGPSATGSGLSWVDPVDYHDYFAMDQKAQGRRFRFKVAYDGSEEYRIFNQKFDFTPKVPRRN